MELRDFDHYKKSIYNIYFQYIDTIEIIAVFAKDIG